MLPHRFQGSTIYHAVPLNQLFFFPPSCSPLFLFIYLFFCIRARTPPPLFLRAPRPLMTDEMGPAHTVCLGVFAAPRNGPRRTCVNTLMNRRHGGDSYSASCGTPGRTPAVQRSSQSTWAIAWCFCNSVSCIVFRKSRPLWIFFPFLAFFHQQAQWKHFLILELGNIELMRRLKDKLNGRTLYFSVSAVVHTPAWSFLTCNLYLLQWNFYCYSSIFKYFINVQNRSLTSLLFLMKIKLKMRVITF